jgi:hypothetical protein
VRCLLAESKTISKASSSTKNRGRYRDNSRKKLVKLGDPYPGLKKRLSDAISPASISDAIYEEIAGLRGVEELRSKKVSEESLFKFFRKLDFYLPRLWFKQHPQYKNFFISHEELIKLESKFELQVKGLISTLSVPYFDRLFLDQSAYLAPKEESTLETLEVTIKSRYRKIREAAGADNYRALVQSVLCDLLFMVKNTQKVPSGVGERSFEIGKARRGDRNQAVLYAATQANDLWENRFPTFLSDVFNSPTVKDIFPDQPPLKPSGIESTLKKIARKNVISGFDPKKNSSKK